MAGTVAGTFRVWWGRVDLGWTDTRERAEGVIRQHINRRQRGQRASRATMRGEYRIEEVPR